MIDIDSDYTYPSYLDEEDPDLTAEYRLCLKDVLNSLELACEEADNIGDATSVFTLHEMWETIDRMLGDS